MPQTQQTPRAPASPDAPIVARVAPDGTIQLTTQDVQGLRVKLEDLRSELQDAASRRRTVAEQLRSQDSRARPGLEERLAVLDARIVALEKDITATGEQLRSVPPHLLASTAPPGEFGEAEAARIAGQLAGDIVPIVAILSIFVFAPIMIALSRFIWRRAGAPVRPALGDQATQQRLEALQQAVDTIAIEVERISEGQRFVTKIMSERSIGAGAAEPARAAKKAAMPTER